MAATVEQLQGEVDELTAKVTQLSNLIALFMVNGLADAFDGTGNQTFGSGGKHRLDDSGYQVAMGTGDTNVGMRFLEAFKTTAQLAAGGIYPIVQLVSKWSGTTLNTTFSNNATSSYGSTVSMVTSSTGALTKILAGAGYVGVNGNASGDYIELVGRAVFSQLTPDQITSDQNNYAPTGLASYSVLRLSSDAARTITGLSSTFGGLVIIMNVGAQNIVLADESASSNAANRFALPAAVTIAADEGVTLVYDATGQRWRVVGRY